jgi:WD40 repeat protein/tRNA A-37 threonylcarbamoyl transferase component Bud32
LGSAARSPQVPGYDLLEELGRGGMGVVYKARHHRLNRLVAIKMILAGGHAGEAELTRFKTEAESLARLQHPNIVQVHDVGEQNGTPYFSLEFCAGGSLDRKLRGTPLPPLEAARLIEILARAVHAAHQAKVIHRDLKPVNILLTEDGIPKITDFGLAKKLDDASGQTQAGAIIGTPSYMAPEQAGAKSQEIGPACDVYALGAILYECLTGRPPFKGPSLRDTIRQVLSEEPVAPSHLLTQTPRDLETICLKCLQKEPARRYPSALALADDLRRYLDGQPVLARPVGRAGRLWRWARRNPASAVAGAVALGGLLVAVVTLSVAVVMVSASRDEAVGLAGRNKTLADENRGLAEEQSRLAGQYRDLALQKEAERRTAQRRAVEVLFADAYNRGETEDAAHGMLWLARALPEAVRAETPDLERSIRVHLAGFSHHLRRHRAEITLDPRYLKGAAFTPDGQMVLTWSKDARLWNATTGEPRSVLPHPEAVFSAAFSPDGKILVTGCHDGKARRWDVLTGKEIGDAWVHTHAVDRVLFSPDGKTVLTVCFKMVRLWSAETGKPVGEPLTTADRETVAAFSPDSRILATGGNDGRVRFWNSSNGKPLREPVLHDGLIRSITFAPNGGTFASIGLKALRLWDATTFEPLGDAITPQLGAIHCLAYSPDGRTMLTGSDGGITLLRDARTGRAIGPPLRHDGNVLAVGFSPDGRIIVTAGSDGTARLWNADTLAPLGPPLQHPQFQVTTATFSPDGRTLLTATEKGTVSLWDVEPRVALGRPLIHKGGVEAVAFSPDGQTVLTGALTTAEPTRRGQPGEARLWAVSTVEPLGPPLPHSSPVSNVAFRPDGKAFLTVARQTVQFWDTTTREPLDPAIRPEEFIVASALSADGKLLLTANFSAGFQLWDTATGKKIGAWVSAGDSPIRAAAFSLDGKLLLTGGEDRTARLWDVANLKPVGEPLQHRGQAGAVAFSTDGHSFLTGEMMGDNVARLWDIERRQIVGPALPHRDLVRVVAFSPDGEVLLTGSSDGTARLWERATGRALGPVLQHGSAVRAGAFSPDGRRVLTGSWDATARLWAVPRPIKGDPEHVQLWVEVQTGLHFDEQGTVKRLEEEEWQERRRRLKESQMEGDDE